MKENVFSHCQIRYECVETDEPCFFRRERTPSEIESTLEEMGVSVPNCAFMELLDDLRFGCTNREAQIHRARGILL